MLENTLTKESLLDYLMKKANADNYKPPIYETELLRVFFKNYHKIMSENDSLSIFKMHFILYHYLYKLKFDFVNSKDYLLHIHLASVYFLRILPDKKRCYYFDEEKLDFCGKPKDENEKYCWYHTGMLDKLGCEGTIQSLALNNYYLDIENLKNMTREELEYQLATWNAICCSPEEIFDCYNELELEPGSDLEKIKEAYHRMAKLYHPDLNNNENTHSKMNKINRAYNILKERINANLGIK